MKGALGLERRAGTAIVMCLLSVCVAAQTAQAAETMLSLEDVAFIWNPSEPTELRLLLSFELPAALEGATIDYAILEASVAVQGEGDRGLAVEVFPTTREWSADSVEWDGAWSSGEGAWDPGAGTYCRVPVGSMAPVRADVTAAVAYCTRAGGETADFVIIPMSNADRHLTGLVNTRPVRIRVFYSAPRE